MAGLFAQSLNKLESTDLKVETRNRYIVHINPQGAGYSQTQLESLYRAMEHRFRALPGMVRIGIASYTPMEDNNYGFEVQVQGQPNLGRGASFIRVNPDYFDSVGTHVVMGRGIGVKDTATAPAVAVVNQSFVNAFFKDRHPLGRHFGSPGPTSSGDFEIVGVVEDSAYTSARWKDHPMCFLPLMRRPPSSKEPITDDMSLYAGAIVLQAARPTSDMESVARRTLIDINPNLTVVKFQTFAGQIADRFNDERMIARLTTLFGALALLLATLGLYGVTAYTVARRTAEIGIRMALGAERKGVIALVMRGAILQTAFGLAIGIPTALVCVRFVKAQLYEITNADPTVMTATIAILAAATCIAGIIPARRAAYTDPVQALRME